MFQGILDLVLNSTVISTFSGVLFILGEEGEKDLLQTAAVVISILTGSILLGKEISRPFQSMKKSLDSLNYSIQMLNKDLEDSKNDRRGIHKDLSEHDRRLDAHDVKLGKHDEQIKTLFKRGESQ